MTNEMDDIPLSLSLPLYKGILELERRREKKRREEKLSFPGGGGLWNIKRENSFPPSCEQPDKFKLLHRNGSIPSSSLSPLGRG